MALAATITPSSTRTGDAPVACAATGATGTVFWDDGGAGGNFSAGTGASVTYTPPNRTQTVNITATDSLTHVTRGLVVRAVIPNYWMFKTPIHAKKPVLIWRPIFGPSQSRGFGNNAAVHDWELADDDSSYENFMEMKAFWEFHYPGKQVDLIDPVLNERRTYEIDSDFDDNYGHGDSFSWAFRIKEAYPFALVA